MSIQNASASLYGTKLFGRQLNLAIGFPSDPGADKVLTAWNDKNAEGVSTGGIGGLRVDYVVNKSLKNTTPSTADIKVYNFNPAHRKALSGAQKLSVKLEVGYEGGVTQIYFAEARSAWTKREGPDFITHVESTDTIARPTGEKTITAAAGAKLGSKSSNLYRTTGAKVPLKDAFAALTASMGIGDGNLKEALNNLRGSRVTGVQGAALIGNAQQRMTDICRSAGLEWSIQDGNLQLVNIGQVLSTTQAIVVSADTGMVEEPAVDSQGAVTFKMLTVPGLIPGCLVNFQTLFIDGGYRVEQVRYEGSTHGNAWYAECTAVKY